MNQCGHKYIQYTCLGVEICLPGNLAEGRLVEKMDAAVGGVPLVLQGDPGIMLIQG